MSYTINPFDLLTDSAGEEEKAKPIRKPKQPKPATPQNEEPPKSSPTPAQPVSAAPKPSAPKPAQSAQSATKEETSNAEKAKPHSDAQKGKVEGGAKSTPQAGGEAHRKDEVIPPTKEDRKPKEHDKKEYERKVEGRPNDRKSGTGRPPNENKKGGGGGANWGKEGEEVQDLGESPKDATGEKEDAEKQADASAAAEPPKPKEPEKEYKSYDEYLESLKKKPVPKFDTPKARTPGEGVDSTEWADYVPLSKEKEKEKAPAAAAGKGRKKEAKETKENGKETKIQPEFYFPSPTSFEERRGGGRGGKPPGRGGRGGGGGGRFSDRPQGGGRGGDRFPDRPQGRGRAQHQSGPTEAVPAPFSPADFPSLSPNANANAQQRRGSGPAQSQSPATAHAPVTQGSPAQAAIKA